MENFPFIFSLKRKKDIFKILHIQPCRESGLGVFRNEAHQQRRIVNMKTDSTNKNEHKWITSGTCEHAVNREGNPHQPHTTQEQAPPSSSALSLDTKGMKSEQN